MRRFRLFRDADVTGISGTGVVAEGVMFSDRTCAMRWLSGRSSTAIYATPDDVVAIHGHGGTTRLEWMD